ncbi:hypothetical protein BS50DRAFT_584674 [Corynespora cassiicola Philippines]|uniref:Uncharacterized protein n=1 Tax=Corynespora cassiicola Philippines TaxID=1448308 RepID=A0A2T2P0G0_CORCC|nr:hypothetical protein BS50DRAFT_584674 [Corynespora cassiicola Philippines]
MKSKSPYSQTTKCRWSSLNQACYICYKCEKRPAYFMENYKELENMCGYYAEFKVTMMKRCIMKYPIFGMIKRNENMRRLANELFKADEPLVWKENARLFIRALVTVVMHSSEDRISEAQINSEMERHFGVKLDERVRDIDKDGFEDVPL